MASFELTQVNTQDKDTTGSDMEREIEENVKLFGNIQIVEKSEIVFPRMRSKMNEDLREAARMLWHMKIINETDDWDFVTVSVLIGFSWL